MKLLLCILVTVRNFAPGLSEISETRQSNISLENSVQYLTNLGISEQAAARIIEDGFLTVPQLLHKYNYPQEVHKTVTSDGYILEIHRIPKPGATPVFLLHGIMDSSAGFVIMGPESALSYYLADHGYDVWMGNIRGNRYSREHVSLNVKSKEFWDFSFHEIGVIDLPTMIDYVLNETGYEKLHFVGHSQGTTAFWALCSEKPEYNNKISSMNAMAPIAFMKDVPSIFIKLVASFVGSLETLTNWLGMHEFLPSSDLLSLAGQLLCKETAITQALCYNIVFLVTGYDSEQLNKTMLPAITGHLPAGSSTKQFVHYGQLVNSGKFRQYDFGTLKNLAKYGSLSPPAYDLSKITTPVYLHFSTNDWLAHPNDVRKLEEGLKNVRSLLVPYSKFNHLDYLFALDSRTLIYDTVIQRIRLEEAKNF